MIRSGGVRLQGSGGYAFRVQGGAHGDLPANMLRRHRALTFSLHARPLQALMLSACLANPGFREHQRTERMDRNQQSE